MLKIIATLSSLLITVLAQESTTASGTFNRIEAGSNVELAIIQDNTNKVDCFYNGQPITSDGIVTIENGTLKLSANQKNRIRAEVHVMEISEVKLQKYALLSIQKLEQSEPIKIELGEKAVFSGKLKSPSVSIYADNGSVVNATLDSKDFVAMIGKDVRARFAGNVKSTDLTAKSNSTVNAIAMRTERATITTEGTANVRSNVSGQITAQLDPESRLTSSGKPIDRKPQMQPEARVVFAN
ncbi:GIN domain-containing protein [Flavobacterium silvaticum]|uniref:Putative auto-transporter adhesin head GIN domain-containing protein n=1 Tax=Flavobacterium silvaticum TaxID=1852020 RepID=A0A972FWK2_9FLAO|nr:DUF2807 domain-containing protein [Flavobacterium silvaticum]NMH29332.1 hypothetical protein [Flavobacterium silvaticum]